VAGKSAFFARTPPAPAGRRSISLESTGAGVICSNLKSLPGNVTIPVDGVPRDTGLRKFGALIGDGAEVGCNSVLNPGSILGRGAIIYPGVSWRGFLPANHIAKNKAVVEVVVKRPKEN